MPLLRASRQDVEAGNIVFPRESMPIADLSTRTSSPARHSPLGTQIVIQCHDGRSMLFSVPRSQNQGNDLKQLRSTVARMAIEHGFRGTLSLYFSTAIVGTGVILLGLPCSHSTPPHTCRWVSLDEFKHDVLLTEVFHAPNSTIDFLSRIPRRSTATNQEHADDKVIVIRFELDKTKVAYTLISLLALSPIVGLTVGIIIHDTHVGVAISAGGFALASFLQGFVAWVEK